MQIFINKLIQLADGLDGLGLTKDANALDLVISKLAAGRDEGGEFGDLLKLFDEPVTLDSDEEKGPVEERVVLDEPEVHTPLDEEEAPLSREKTGPSRLDMIKRRHDLLKLKNKIKQEEENEYLDKMEDEVGAADQVHLPEAEPMDEDFEDEDEAVNEADDGGLLNALTEKLKSVPELATKLLTIIKENPELLELLI